MADKDLASTSNEIKNMGKETVIEVPDDLETTLRREICIYPVPVNLRRINEAAYTPQLISIGPIHFGNKNLEGMETQKLRYYKEFFDRRRSKEDGVALLNNLETTIKSYQGCICSRYEDAYCYQDKKSQLRSAFSKMILLDVVFIFELFLRTFDFKIPQNRSSGKYKHDFILGKPCVRYAIQRDLILLENQLPFKTLDKLYSVATKHITTDCSCFLVLSYKYFEDYREDNKDEGEPLEEAKRQKPLHFTDLVRFFLSSKHPKLKSEAVIDKLYRATWLHQAGIQFKPLRQERKGECKCFGQEREGEGESSKKKNVLYVPPLEIDDNTECLLRNLMALEQCHYPDEAYICNYVKFLDFLVDIGEDADLLVESEVIINRLGENATVAELINKLCLEIVEDYSCYYHLAKQLNEYYESCCNRCWAYFRRVYFRNVWIGTGTVVGLIVLFITLAQFVLSFL